MSSVDAFKDRNINQGIRRASKNHSHRISTLRFSMCTQINSWFKGFYCKSYQVCQVSFLCIASYQAELSKMKDITSDDVILAMKS